MITCEPTQCIYWKKPKQILGNLKDKFELLDTFEHESHWWRYLLKCRECGQLYFFEFYEFVDWDGGNDPQYTKYIPIGDINQLEILRKATPEELLQFSPSLNVDFPKEAESHIVYWTGRTSTRF